jgi:hypothetical protein
VFHIFCFWCFRQSKAEIFFCQSMELAVNQCFSLFYMFFFFLWDIKFLFKL